MNLKSDTSAFDLLFGDHSWCIFCVLRVALDGFVVIFYSIFSDIFQPQNDLLQPVVSIGLVVYQWKLHERAWLLWSVIENIGWPIPEEIIDL
jgi:hypothetical protein